MLLRRLRIRHYHIPQNKLLPKNRISARIKAPRIRTCVNNHKRQNLDYRQIGWIRHLVTSRKTSTIRCLLPGALFTNRGLGCGDLKTLTAGRSCANNWEARSALRPMSTAARSLGSRSRTRVSARTPASVSVLPAARMRIPVPVYQGMIFHVTVRFLGISASRFNSKKFLAVSSGLLREIKPVNRALAPGASSRNRISASIPPSQGSKFGMLPRIPTSARSFSTNFAVQYVARRVPPAGLCAPSDRGAAWGHQLELRGTYKGVAASNPRRPESFGPIHYFFSIASRFALNSVPGFHSGNLSPFATW